MAIIALVLALVICIPFLPALVAIVLGIVVLVGQASPARASRSPPS